MTEISERAKPAAQVWFVDVGNGDCTVVVDEETHCALVIDCPSSHVKDVKNLLTQARATLHTCVVTHWDADHYGGVARLAVAFPVQKVMYNHDTLFESDDSPPYAVRGALKNFLNVSDAPHTLAAASAGSEGGFGRVSWRMLAPSHHELTMAYVSHKRNIASAVMDISLPSLRILIGGDAVASTWQRLMSEDLRADILRWPHHGADLAGDGSGLVADLVMNAVQPQYIVVSAGSSNTYGHPSSAIIRNVRSRGSLLCTQVTAGCFGFLTRAERNSDAARGLIGQLDVSHCAGTVKVECYDDLYRVSPSDSEHEARIGQWPHPMCRTQTTAVSAGDVREVVPGSPTSST